ncbi:MAG: carboxypeptidase regulatory-like domain-containing protein, partial [Richelia sp. CSU_2_1]|nr:carboxypeptidase regulatory-like domain-containing protein [Richelia sp. CSU_2_1]
MPDFANNSFPHNRINSLPNYQLPITHYQLPITNMNDNSPPEALKQILKAFTDAGSENINALQQVRDVQVVMGSLLQHEAKRLEKKLGRDNLRVQQIQSTIKRNQAISKDLEVELEIAKIRVPEVDQKDSLIHGRVVNENRRGWSGLVVSLADVQGKIIRALGKAETQDSGYYALTINAETLKKVAKSITEGVFVVIYNSKGELIYRHKDLLMLKGGDRILVEDIVLKRSDLTSPPCETPAVSNTEVSSSPSDSVTVSEFAADVWVARGRVVDENGEGIGGLVVSLFDRDLIFADRLGNTQTDENGEFIVTYRTADFQDLFDAHPDLYLKILDAEGNTLYSSEEA